MRITGIPVRVPESPLEALILCAWVPSRLLFLAFWSFANPIGHAQAWLAERYRLCIATGVTERRD